MSKKHPTKCTTGARTRCSYLNINAPKAYGDGKPKFSASLIIPKDDVATLNKIDAAMRAAYEDGVSILKGKGRTVPTYEEIIKDGPLHDGDKKKAGDSAYQNAFYLNAKNERRPGVVDSNNVEEICKIMGQTPPWLPGLTLRADGYECDFYKKD